jgi:hypothetical protein
VLRLIQILRWLPLLRLLFGLPTYTWQVKTSGWRMSWQRGLFHLWVGLSTVWAVYCAWKGLVWMGHDILSVIIIVIFIIVPPLLCLVPWRIAWIVRGHRK